MKRVSILFLQGVIVLVGIMALSMLIWFPMTEGRAVDLDLFSIYTDPFILYGYASSIPFFVALYKAFKVLGYIGQNKLYSPNSVRAIRTIKYCATLFSILIVLAGLYIKIFHGKDDDPAGFLAMCIAATFIAILIATTASVLEKKLQIRMDKNSENDQSI